MESAMGQLQLSALRQQRVLKRAQGLGGADIARGEEPDFREAQDQMD
jgi:hypothetical protein